MRALADPSSQGCHLPRQLCRCSPRGPGRRRKASSTLARISAPPPRPASSAGYSDPSAFEEELCSPGGRHPQHVAHGRLLTPGQGAVDEQLQHPGRPRAGVGIELPGGGEYLELHCARRCGTAAAPPRASRSPRGPADPGTAPWSTRATGAASPLPVRSPGPSRPVTPPARPPVEPPASPPSPLLSQADLVRGGRQAGAFVAHRRPPNSQSWTSMSAYRSGFKRALSLIHI